MIWGSRQLQLPPPPKNIPNNTRNHSLTNIPFFLSIIHREIQEQC
jgi:hypothetical protein